MKAPYKPVINYSLADSTPIMPDLADLMTPKEAAETIGFNINSIYRLIESGKLEGMKVGKKQWLIPRESVAKYT